MNWVKSFLETNPAKATWPVFKRAKHSLHLVRPDGKIEANFTGAPCHFQDILGEWHPLDTTPILEADGFYGAPGLDTRIHPDGRVRVKNSNYEQWIELPGNPKGVVEGDAIVRTFAGGKQTLRITETGFREEIIIEKKTFPFEKFIVKKTGTLPAQYTEGVMVARDANGVEYIFTGDSTAFGEWLDNAYYPVTIDPDFADSTADGYIVGAYSTNYNTARGTSSVAEAAANALTMGQYKDGDYYRVYRAYLKFNTSPIGAGAVVTQANLKLVCTSDSSTVDFDVKIVKQDWTNQDPMGTANREALYDNCLTSTLDDNIWRNTSGMSTGTVYTSGNLSTAWIVVTGNTYYSVCNANDYSNTAPTNLEYLNFASQEHTTAAYRPILTVVHIVEATATLTGTLGAMTLAATSTIANTVYDGTLTGTLGALTFASTAGLTIAGTLTGTLGALTLSGAGDIDIAGTLTGTLGGLALASVCQTSRSATLAAILGAITSTSTGAMTIAGTLIGTLDVLVLSSTSVLPIAGVATNTLDALVSASAAQLPIVGTVDQTLDALALVSIGICANTAELTVTLDAITISSSAALTINAIVDASLDALISTSEGGLSIAGSITSTLGALVLSSVSTIESVNNDLAITLDDLVLSSASQTISSATLSQELEALAFIAESQITITGVLAGTLEDTTSSSAAQIEVMGALDGTLDAVVLSSNSGLVIAGTASNTLDALVSSSAAGIVITGSLDATLSALVSASVGAVTVTGAVDATLGNLQTSLAGALIIAGTTSTTFEDAIFTSTSALLLAGATNTTLDSLAISGAGALTITGTLSSTLGDVISSSAGTLSTTGSLDTSLAVLLIVAIGSIVLSPGSRATYASDSRATYAAKSRKTFKP